MKILDSYRDCLVECNTVLCGVHTHVGVPCYLYVYT